MGISADRRCSLHKKIDEIPKTARNESELVADLGVELEEGGGGGGGGGGRGGDYGTMPRALL
jgi:hypothetical protein